MKDKLTSI